MTDLWRGLEPLVKHWEKGIHRWDEWVKLRWMHL